MARYAKSGDLNIAYQVVGDGPVDLVLSFGRRRVAWLGEGEESVALSAGAVGYVEHTGGDFPLFLAPRQMLVVRLAQEGGQMRAVSAELKPGLPVGNWVTNLQLVTNSPVSPKITMPAAVELREGATPDDVLDAARASGTVTDFGLERPTLTDLFREAVAA